MATSSFIIKMETIDKRISELSIEDRNAFYNDLESVLYSRVWCLVNDIDYSKPDIQKVKEKLYFERYKK